MHLSIFKVHKYPDLMRLEVEVHVWGVHGVEGIPVSEERKKGLIANMPSKPSG